MAVKVHNPSFFLFLYDQPHIKQPKVQPPMATNVTQFCYILFNLSLFSFTCFFSEKQFSLILKHAFSYDCFIYTCTFVFFRTSLHTTHVRIPLILFFLLFLRSPTPTRKIFFSRTHQAIRHSLWEYCIFYKLRYTALASNNTQRQ